MKSILTFLSALLITSPLLAQEQTEFEGVSRFDQPKGYASLSLGLGLLDVSDATLGFGADMGILFSEQFSGNLFFLSSGHAQDDGEAELTHYGLGANYVVTDGLFMNSRVGLRLGAASETVDGKTETSFSFGPQAAYLYPITDTFSAGAEVVYLINPSIENSSTLYVQATGSYWF